MNERRKGRVAAALDEVAARGVPARVDLRPAIHARLGLDRPVHRPRARARRAAAALVVLLAAGLAALALVPGAGARLVGLVAPPPVTFHATLTFTPPLSVDAFTAFVHETGVLPVQNRLQGTDAQGTTVSIGAAGQWARDATGRELDGTPQPGGDGIDTAHLRQFLGDKTVTNLVVLSSDVLLDRAIYARLQHDRRIALDTGSKEPPAASADAVVARWKAAFAAIRTLRGGQQFALVHEDGSPAAMPPALGLPATADEVFELSGPAPRRYRVDQKTTQGERLTVWDGAHAYRYWSWLHEVYRPQPESQSAYWMDDLDDWALPYFLRPANVGYNLVGPAQLDGRAVIELVVKGGNEGPAGLDGTRVWLDAATYLPVRVTVYTPGAQTGLQRTFSDLRINVPLSDADFAFSPPPGTLTVYEQAYMAPRLAIYKTPAAAAAAAGVPLYAPPTLQTEEIYAQYIVEQDGRRFPVIALNSGAILEGRILPADENARDPSTAPPQRLTIVGRPATLQAGVLTFSKGETQIRLTGVQDPASAEKQAVTLQPLGGDSASPLPPTETPAPAVPSPTSAGAAPPAGAPVRAGPAALLSLEMVDEQAGWALWGRMFDTGGVAEGRLARTSDGGRTWTDVTPAGVAAGGTATLAIQALDARTAWIAVAPAAGRYAPTTITVFRTADGGATWASGRVESRYGFVLAFPDVAFDFTDARQGRLMLWGAGGMSSTPGQLFSTSDGGTSWTEVASTTGGVATAPGALPFGGAIRFRDAATGWLAGSAAGTAPHLLYVTRDGGRTWQPQALPLPVSYDSGSYSVLAAPTFFGPDRQEGVVPLSRDLATATFCVTHDGGRSWAPAGPPAPWFPAMPDFVTPRAWFVWTPGPAGIDGARGTPASGALYRTQDAGRSWSAVAPDAALGTALRDGYDVSQVRFVGPDVGWVVLSRFGTEARPVQPPYLLFRTQDGGRTWELLPARLAGLPGSPPGAG